jgi:hypothetical protein
MTTTQEMKTLFKRTGIIALNVGDVTMLKCLCGAELRKSNAKRHTQSLTHRRFMEQIPDIEAERKAQDLEERKAQEAEKVRREASGLSEELQRQHEQYAAEEALYNEPLSESQNEFFEHQRKAHAEHAQILKHKLLSRELKQLDNKYKMDILRLVEQYGIDEEHPK